MNIYNIYKGGLHQDRLNRIILNFIFIAIYYIKNYAYRNDELLDLIIFVYLLMFIVCLMWNDHVDDIHW